MSTKKNSADTSVTTIELPEIQLEYFDLQIVGTSPLICHAWSEKAKRMMLATQQKKAKTGKEARRPNVDFAETLYWLTPKPDLENLTDEEAAAVLAEVIPNSKFGFPTLAFKAAALNAGYQQGALKRNAGTNDLAKTTARGAFHVLGEMAVIEGIPTLRQDMVKLLGKTADLCFRSEFKDWRTTLHIRYNKTSISPEQIINLFRLGGFANGIGDWRPEKNGSYGTFDVNIMTI